MEVENSHSHPLYSDCRP